MNEKAKHVISVKLSKVRGPHETYTLRSLLPVMWVGGVRCLGGYAQTIVKIKLIPQSFQYNFHHQSSVLIGGISFKNESNYEFHGCVADNIRSIS